MYAGARKDEDLAALNAIDNVTAVRLDVTSQDQVDAGVDPFNNVLLAFALVAVFVSVFIISNTFNILLGQRVRELALLRERTKALLEGLKEEKLNLQQARGEAAELQAEPDRRP